MDSTWSGSRPVNPRWPPGNSVSNDGDPSSTFFRFATRSLPQSPPSRPQSSSDATSQTLHPVWGDSSTVTRFLSGPHVVTPVGLDVWGSKRSSPTSRPNPLSCLRCADLSLSLSLEPLEDSKTSFPKMRLPKCDVRKLASCVRD